MSLAGSFTSRPTPHSLAPCPDARLTSLLDACVNYLAAAVISPGRPLIEGSPPESMFTQYAFFFNYPNCLETDKDSTFLLPSVD